MSEARLYDLCAARRLREDLQALEAHSRAITMPVTVASGQPGIEATTVHFAPSANSIIIDGMQFTYTARGSNT